MLEQDYENPYEHLMRNQKTIKYASKMQNARVMSQTLSDTPLSFNFKIPETIIVKQGKPTQWYYSNDLGQIRLRDENNDQSAMFDHFSQFTSDYTKPAAVVLHNSEEIQKEY